VTVVALLVRQVQQSHLQSSCVLQMQQATQQLALQQQMMLQLAT